MLYHKNLLNAVAATVTEIFGEGKHADKQIKKLFLTNKKWGARDRKFVAETIYEIVRWWRLLWECSGKAVSFKAGDIHRLIAVYLIIRGKEIPKFEEYSDLDIPGIMKRYEEVSKIRAVRESIPDWLDELGARDVKGWDNVIHELNKEAEVVLRVNTIKISKKELSEILRNEGIETYSDNLPPDALVLKERRNIFLSESFKKGYFEVQDVSSQLVAPFADAEPGMRVIDACAGAGGKSLHLASLMENKGKIVSLDIHEWKLDLLKERARRNGIFIIETRVIQSNKVIKRLKESADRVLLDVPCSGLGVLKRNPDTKWKISLQSIEDVIKEQAEILDNYNEMVKPGGRLIYSTCSIFPNENEKQIEVFLVRNRNYKLTDQKLILPTDNGFDGFFMASLERKS